MLPLRSYDSTLKGGNIFPNRFYLGFKGHPLHMSSRLLLSFRISLVFRIYWKVPGTFLTTDPSTEDSTSLVVGTVTVDPLPFPLTTRIPGRGSFDLPRVLRSSVRIQSNQKNCPEVGRFSCSGCTL